MKQSIINFLSALAFLAMTLTVVVGFFLVVVYQNDVVLGIQSHLLNQ